MLLRPILVLLLAMSSMACTPADADKPVADPAASAVRAAPAKAAPPADTTTLARPSPGVHHGNWRLVAADDPHDAALMAFLLETDADDARGSGDFVLFQPFCDVVAGVPIVGNADCELIDLSAHFDRVDIDQNRIVLTFQPTADGSEHRLELHRQGETLIGEYIAQANDIRRAVIAVRSPADTP